MMPRVPRIRRGFWLCRQQDSSDCGSASLAMVARHHGRRVPVGRLREMARTDLQGASVLGLSRAAERIGFRTLRVKTTFDQLAANAPLPCIAYWEQRHFVVVYRIDGDRVYVADPGVGLVRYTRDEFLRGWQSGQRGDTAFGVVLLLEPTPALLEDDGTPSRRDEADGAGWSLVLEQGREHVGSGARVMVGVVAVSLLQLVLPFLTQVLVDVGVTGQNVGFVYLILIAQVVLILTRTGVDFIQGWIMLHAGARINIALVAGFLGKLMRLPLGFFDSRQIGDILQRVEDHGRLEEFLTSTVLFLLNSAFTFLVFGAALLYYDATAFGIFCAGAVLYTLHVALFLRGRRRIDHQRFGQMSVNRTLLIETITGMPEIKINGAEQQKRWQWERSRLGLYRLNQRALRLEQFQEGGAQLINQVTNAVVTAYAAQSVIRGELTLGGLLAVQYLLGQLNTPLGSLVTILRNVQDTKLSLERVADVRTLREEDGAGGPSLPVPASGSLVLENVRFGYRGDDGPQVFDGLSLEIPRGKVTAIVGSSGSGKSTLLKLLLRFYDPTAGRVLVGGVSLEGVSHQLWRQHCGVVMQAGYLFSDTIARNIALGHDEIDPERLLHAAEVAALREVIEALPLAYETKLGSDGGGLSQGQKQRLLIARAVYQDPEFLFFDEATSALDAESERRIVHNLEHLFGGRTVVVIAHRLSTVRNADQIVVLERGRVVEQGTHDELVCKRGGRYLELVKNQLEIAS